MENAEANKRSYAKEGCEERGVILLPLAVDTFGGFGSEAVEALEKVAKQTRMCRGEDTEMSRGRLLQRLQVVLFRGIARQLLRRLTYDEEVPERPI